MKSKNALTVQDLTRIVGCTENTILNWINKGALKAKVDWQGLKRSYEIEKDDWEAFWAEKKKTLRRFRENT